MTQPQVRHTPQEQASAGSPSATPAVRQAPESKLTESTVAPLSPAEVSAFQRKHGAPAPQGFGVLERPNQSSAPELRNYAPDATAAIKSPVEQRATPQPASSAHDVSQSDSLHTARQLNSAPSGLRTVPTAIQTRQPLPSELQPLKDSEQHHAPKNFERGPEQKTNRRTDAPPIKAKPQESTQALTEARSGGASPQNSSVHQDLSQTNQLNHSRAPHDTQGPIRPDRNEGAVAPATADNTPSATGVLARTADSSAVIAPVATEQARPLLEPPTPGAQVKAELPREEVAVVAEGPVLQREQRADGAAAKEIAEQLHPERSVEAAHNAPPATQPTVPPVETQEQHDALAVFSITGRVVHMGGGGIAAVRIDCGTLGSCHTDIFGEFAIDNLPVGTGYSCAASHHGLQFKPSMAYGVVTGPVWIEFVATRSG